MQIASMHFKERAHDKLDDALLQKNLVKFKTKFVGARKSAITELDDFEGTREAARAIRQRALDDLDVWLELFEAQRHGARRHGAVRADAGRGQQARARHRLPPRRAQDHQVEVDGVGGVRRSTTRSKAPA